MGDEVKVKKRQNNIGKFFNSMTDEEKKAWRVECIRKRTETNRKKREAVKLAKEKAIAMLPEILAQEMLLLDNDQYTPRPEVLNKLKDLLDSGLSIEQMRRKHFSSMTEKAWDKLMKHVFKGQVANKEHLGNELLQSFQKNLDRMDKHIKDLEKEIRLTRKHNKEKYGHKKTSATLLELLGAALKERREYEINMKKTLSSVAMDDGKSKANAAIHIHTSVPRPKPAEDANVVKDITPSRQSLTDLIG